VLPPIPRPTQLRPPQAGGEPHPLPAAPLLHGGFRAVNLPRLAAVPVPDDPGADAADVGRAQHDVRRRPPARTVPDGVGDVPREDEHEGGGPADDKRAEQELVVLRGVDSEQREVERVRHSPHRPLHVLHLHGQLHLHPGDVPARLRSVHRHVQEKGFLALVHRGGHGRDGVHGG